MSFAARPLLWRLSVTPLVIVIYSVAWWYNPAAVPVSFLDDHAGAPTLKLSPSSPFVNSFASSDVDDYVHSAALTPLCDDSLLTVWFAGFMPSGSPADAIKRMAELFGGATKTAKMQEFFVNFGGATQSSTPDELGRFVASETAKWARIVKSAGIVPE